MHVNELLSDNGCFDVSQIIYCLKFLICCYSLIKVRVEIN